jgi:hypothetical protein
MRHADYFLITNYELKITEDLTCLLSMVHVKGAFGCDVEAGRAASLRRHCGVRLERDIF